MKEEYQIRHESHSIHSQSKLLLTFGGAVFWTLLDQLIPFLRPTLQTFCINLFDLSSLLDQGHQIVTQSKAVLRSFGGALKVHRLPKRIGARHEQRIVAVV